MTRIDNINRSALADFLEWYVEFFERSTTPPSVLAACMTGYFHISNKAAISLLARCKAEGLVEIGKEEVRIICCRR